MSITGLSLLNNNVICFPDEIDTNGKVNYDLSKLSQLASKETLSALLPANVLAETDCFITLKTASNSGFVLTLAQLFNKQVLYIEPSSGFPYYGSRKFNYKLKYTLWLDTVCYDNELIQGLEKLAKRGLRINNIITLIDCHEGVKLFINEVLPNTVYNPFYELYDLMSIYESKGLLTGFLVEKCKFIADKNRKHVHQYLETYTKNKLGSYDYIKNSEQWYIDNYLCYNNLLSDTNVNDTTNNDTNVLNANFNNLVLKYITPINWDNMRKELISYGDNINKLIVYPENIRDLDLNELLLLQKKYSFKIIEYSPYFKLLDTRKLEMFDLLKKNNGTPTKFDGVVYSLSLSCLNNIEFKNDLIRFLSSITTKVLLYINVENGNDIKLLQELILYSNEYMNACIQGIIFDYDNIKKFVIDKKLYLSRLVPLILNITEISGDVRDYFISSEYDSLLMQLSTVPLERRSFNWFKSFQDYNKHSSINKLIQDDTNKENINTYIKNFKYSLEKYLNDNNTDDNNTELDNNDEMVDDTTKYTLFSYISPFAWYSYFLGN
jgi:hypothetical protein